MTPGPTKRVHNCCGKNGAEPDKKTWSWLMENSKNKEKNKIECFGRKRLVTGQKTAE
ncbi:hypothetical protein T11_4072, partial [Trichinella zimbabwensis]